MRARLAWHACRRWAWRRCGIDGAVRRSGDPSVSGAGLWRTIVGRVVARMNGTIDFAQRERRYVVRVALPLQR